MVPCASFARHGRCGQRSRLELVRSSEGPALREHAECTPVPMVDSLRRRLPEMVEALEALVEAESPSADPKACESCASVADGIALQTFGRSAERLIVDGRTHLRWRFGEQRRVLIVGHVDTVWPIGTAARWPF